ncbi:MAG: LacI family DNA-binding transcriptional regulator [Rhodospirillales bacterium]|nr:LacI family DNA-binding transcriptional regulator [Rhodospirillales bacterium]
MAGVDKSTVSRMLGGDKTLNIREETRQRISRAVAALGYRPNMAARSLRTARSFSLGITIASLDNPVYSAIIRGAEQGAADAGYSLLIAHMDEAAPDSRVYHRLVEQHRVDGLLVTTLRNEKEHLAALKELQAPFVLVNRKAKGVRNSVVVNDFGGAKAAVETLIRMGHRDIAHLSGNPSRYNARQRLLGYRAALEEAGIPFRPGLVVEADYTPDGGERAARVLMETQNRRFTAVFAVTLVAAAGALAAFHERGFSIPEDISVVGFHDSAVAELLYPPLTTVRVPLEEMGRFAAGALIDIIEGRRREITKTFSQVEVIERRSTAPLRAGSNLVARR